MTNGSCEGQQLLRLMAPVRVSRLAAAVLAKRCRELVASGACIDTLAVCLIVTCGLRLITLTHWSSLVSML